MQKKLIIALAVILLLVVGGIFYYRTKSASTATTNPTSAQNTSGKTMADAISKAGTVSCNYTDEKGRSFKTFVKNGKIRSDIISTNTKEAGSVIITDQKMYFWNKEMAYVMEIPDSVAQQAVGAGAESKPSQKDEMMKQIDQYRQYCKAATISDDLFIPPADVKFQDYSTMVPQAPTGGAGAAGGVTKEQMNQYMQQYQNQQ